MGLMALELSCWAHNCSPARCHSSQWKEIGSEAKKGRGVRAPAAESVLSQTSLSGGCFLGISSAMGGKELTRARISRGWPRVCSSPPQVQHLCTRPTTATILNCSAVCSTSARTPELRCQALQPFHTKDSGLKGWVPGLCT